MRIFNLLNENGNGGGGEWVMFAILGGLVGLFILMMFLQRRRQRNMMETQGAMLDRLRMGMRVKTVSGVIGRIKEIREEVGGLRTVLIESGNDKFTSFMQVDINAIMEIVNDHSEQVEQVEQVEQPKIEAGDGFDVAEFVEKSNNERQSKPKRKSS